MTIHVRDPGPAFTVVRLARQQLVRAVFTQGAHAITVLSGFSEGSAHEVADGLWGYCALELGTVPEGDEPVLYPLSSVPKSGCDHAGLLANIRRCDPMLDEFAVRRIHSGAVLEDMRQHYLRETLAKIIGDHALRESLGYFVESARNCQSHMSMSFYQVHYRRERARLSSVELLREYRQNRARYESAFVAGFKALERLFGGGQLKKHSIGEALEKLDRPGLRPGGPYVRLFEVPSGTAGEITCEELVCRFLDVRNAVAAHANRNPPAALRVSLDTVFELQHFLRHAYRRYLEPVKPFQRPVDGRRRHLAYGGPTPGSR